MSLNPHRKAKALRTHLCRIVALVTMAALITPSAALIITRTAQARTASPAPAAPISAPPQPFHVGNETQSSPMLALNASVVSGVASLFAVKPLPPEFSIGHLPTFSDKVTSVYGSALGLVAPLLVTKKAPAPPTPSVAPVNFDFDNDGKADFGRWHSSTNEFKVIGSTAGTLTYSVGTSSYIAAPGDYDNDGKTDAAVFNGTTWKYKTSTGGTEQSVTFGSAGDIPVPGNYVGSSRTDMAVYRPSTGVWYMKEAVYGTVTSSAWGNSGDQPIPGDYDGDGVMDFAVFRPSNGTWYINGSTMGVYIAAWGVTGDVPVPADYDGDGKTDLAVYRPTVGTWYVLKSSDSSVLTPGWGNYGDQPAPADYNGDGKADFCVWRPKTGTWYVMHSSDYSYEYASIGVAGDTAVSSAYIQQIGASVSPDLLAAARLSPKNATGGTNLYSQNFSWGTQLVGLPGRSGLDAGFGISYNSLVWTKVGSSMVFDPDTSNVSPGFRFGFPVIEPNYYDAKTTKFSYLMVTPSGGRVEFRQTAASDTYETADSSYAQLVASEALSPNDPTDGVKLKVTTTDGTQMSYSWKGGAFRCQSITDRNGNYITISHDDDGLLRTVTDTLGRVITVNYDSALYPTSITQDWKNSNGGGSTTVTHTWATFTYTTTSGIGDYPAIATSFDPGLTVFGPANGTTMRVLQKITYPDGSSTKFYYNGYAQVDKIENYSAETTPTLLNYVSNNLISVPTCPSHCQTDVPRLTDTYNWVKNFNVVSGSEVATHTTNSVTTGASYSVGGFSGTATEIDVSMASDPYNSVTKAFVGSSGWNEGLPIATEDWADGSSGSERKRWSYTAWAQDHTSLDSSNNPLFEYLLNPRVTETRVGDTSNVKRTTIDYLMQSGSTADSQFGLTSEIKVYDAGLSTVIKKVHTEYNTSPNYISRRIIGLPSEVLAYGKNDVSTLLETISDTTYLYDGSGYTGTGQSLTSATHHDDTNYGTGFSYRGNLTSANRHDPGSVLADTTTSAVYNIAGLPISSTDAASRTSTVSYADVWNDSVSRTTYAYPTAVTDPAGNTANIKYRFDIGANVWAKSPNLNSTTAGKESTRELDSIGRISKETIVTNGAYTRYEYPTNGVQSVAYSTLVDGDNDGADADDEVMSESWTDGSGRTLKSRSPHPGSSGGWAGTLTEYDILGRVKRNTVPTEISVSGTTWTPAGDDNRGTGVWLWNSQNYDWKGRVTKIIPSDSTGSDDKVQDMSYEGCGCAGGQVTTIKGENIVETDWSGTPTSTLGRRTQKVYEDILGRNFKTETYTWDGAALYGTTFNKFNGRDQVLDTKQYDGGTGSSNYRSVTMTYDGFGRMATRHYPIEDSGTNTSWAYNMDDSIDSITDPRGVVTNFSYYSTSGLPHQITYDVPSGLTSSVPNTPDVTFGYDNVGNRTSMTDGTGSASYSYDNLGQINEETKTYTGLSGSFTIDYTYTLSGALKTMSNPHDTTRKVVFNRDLTGRVIGADLDVSGTATQYIHDAQYRAWGDLKGYNYDIHSPYPTIQTFFNFEYDNRLQVSGYAVGRGSTPATVTFQRYADGKLKTASDEHLYKYDFAGRLTKGYTAVDANPASAISTVPYKQELTYNAFSQVTGVTAKLWGTSIPNTSSTYSLLTGRITNNTTYDAAGNAVSHTIQTTPTVINQTTTFDAAGRQVETFDPLRHPCCENNNTLDTSYDGDGSLVKKVSISSPPSGPSTTGVTYEIRSTVLGGESVGEYTPSTTYPQQIFMVPVAGGTLTDKNIIGYSETVVFSRTGPEGAWGYESDMPTSRYDPHGSDIGMDDPATTGGFVDGTYGRGNDPSLYDRCAEGGVPMSCDKQAKFDKRGNELITQVLDQLAKEKAETSPPETQHGSSSGSSNVPPRKTQGEIHDSPEARQTTSTNKPTGDPQKQGTVDPASIPSSGGPSGNFADPSADFAALSGGTTVDRGDLATVQSESANDGLVDAGVSADRPKIENLSSRKKDGYLPSCAVTAIQKYYASVGNSSPARTKLVEEQSATLQYSTWGFPALSPPALHGENKEGHNDVAAYTEGNHIYFDVGQYDPTTAVGMALLVHEFTHVMQYAEVPGFQARYIKQWWKNGRGRQNSYERRAYTNEDKARDFFEKNPQMLCGPAVMKM